MVSFLGVCPGLRLTQPLSSCQATRCEQLFDDDRDVENEPEVPVPARSHTTSDPLLIRRGISRRVVVMIFWYY
jgi:hypothetical protein